MKIKLIIFLLILIIIVLIINFNFLNRNKLKINNQIIPLEIKTRAYEFENIKNNKTLEEWKNINNNITAILKFKQKEMPVVKANNNFEYLHKNIYNEDDFYGALYFDSDSFLDDDNIIIYGHSSNKKDMLLSKIKDFKDKLDNQDIILTTKNQVIKYEPLAFIEVNQEDDDRYMGWFVRNFDNEHHFNQYISSLIKEKNLIKWFKEDRYNYKKYLTLITCDLSKNNSRFILISRVKDL